MDNNQETQGTFRLIELRRWSPQWEVLWNEKSVARVTELYVSSPPFIVVFLDKEGKEIGEPFKFSTREQVMAAILKKVQP